MRTPSGLYKDHPAFPLLQALISYWGITDAPGNLLGTTIVCGDLANEPSYQRLPVKVLDGGAAGPGRSIDTHPAGTAILTVDEPFTDNTGAAVQIVAGTRFVILSSDGAGIILDWLEDIFNLVNAILFTTETGGTILTDGTEQDVYINNAPAGVYEPLKVMIDFSVFVRGAENHGSQATETIVVRTYYRIYPGGNLIKKDEVTFAGVQDPALKNIELEPNRYGIRVTMERTAGNARYYDWEVIYRA